MVDLLTAFAVDLAASFSEAPLQARSGGSDDRMYAEQWFDRNVMPGVGSQRPEFVRVYRTEGRRA